MKRGNSDELSIETAFLYARLGFHYFYRLGIFSGNILLKLKVFRFYVLMLLILFLFLMIVGVITVVVFVVAVVVFLV